MSRGSNKRGAQAVVIEKGQVLGEFMVSVRLRPQEEVSPRARSLYDTWKRNVLGIARSSSEGLLPVGSSVEVDG